MERNIVKYSLNRLKEPSTWRGIILAGTGALGLALNPDFVDPLVYIGVGLAGLLGVFLPDKK